ncbi:MAG TPA: thiamine pyrophosphate-dependent enzyme, partial [Ilumatobacteraceae bacterium]|nr:thiamine pyrophosphate-dependent enzyme [Ilumatobacteraceae bacterium]
PSAYRPADEVQSWPLGDPIERLVRHLIRTGVWTELDHQHARAEAAAEVDAAFARAEAHGVLGDEHATSPATMFEDVYADVPPALVRQRQQAGY